MRRRLCHRATHFLRDIRTCRSGPDVQEVADDPIRSDVRAEARLRQLCCLGAPGPQLAAPLFAELHRVLPHETCLHLWVGPQGPVDAFFNVRDIGESVQRYADDYYKRIESEVWPTMEEALRTEVGPHHVHQVLRIPKHGYYRHPLYNEVLRPSGTHTFIRMMVRDGGVPAGAFNVGRGPRDRDFDDADLRTLARFEPFIAHALRSREPVATPETCDADTALIILDRDRQRRWQSASADRLLSLAAGSALQKPALPAGLQRAVQALQQVASADERATVPAWRSHNAWGSFLARAYWLLPGEPAESMIGIQLERRVPLALRLYEKVRDSNLPLRQGEVCLRLALGHTQEQVASDLGVTRNTVVYHRRQLYNRFAVESREGLRERLLAH